MKFVKHEQAACPLISLHWEFGPQMFDEQGFSLDVGGLGLTTSFSHLMKGLPVNPLAQLQIGL